MNLTSDKSLSETQTKRGRRRAVFHWLTAIVLGVIGLILGVSTQVGLGLIALGVLSAIMAVLYSFDH